MIESVKCYNFSGVMKLLEYDNVDNRDDYDRWLEMIWERGLKVFQPPKSPGSGRAKKQRHYYITTNKWFDQYMKEKNVWGVLKGRIAVKPCYKKYEKESTIIILEHD